MDIVQTKIITGIVKGYNREVELSDTPVRLQDMLADKETDPSGEKLPIISTAVGARAYTRATIYVVSGNAGAFPVDDLAAGEGFKYPAGSFIELNGADLLKKMYFRKYGVDATTIAVMIQS